MALKINRFFFIKQDEDKFRRSVKAIVLSAKISCARF